MILGDFYRKAIVDNVPEVDNMKTSILATLFHCMLTNAKPMHSKCPEGKLSWFFYNKAKADNIPGSHKSMKTKLLEEVVAKTMPASCLERNSSSLCLWQNPKCK
ncbi:uncharacterized protein TNIN_350101 [Trichonephila inaurata madagascariensis]|uniref:Uncharacterized protein n=1 Tax=Trichonephila inaurata madagascariensis TaxID=2747483 RepID=A0A8X6IPW9_9ARAC|nr:uncharacterized protein TNIN_350101 [Trichonephila inaurata madagascariensis]